MAKTRFVVLSVFRTQSESLIFLLQRPFNTGYWTKDCTRVSSNAQGHQQSWYSSGGFRHAQCSCTVQPACDRKRCSASRRSARSYRLDGRFMRLGSERAQTASDTTYSSDMECAIICNVLHAEWASAVARRQGAVGAVCCGCCRADAAQAICTTVHYDRVWRTVWPVMNPDSIPRACWRIAREFGRRYGLMQ